MDTQHNKLNMKLRSITESDIHSVMEWSRDSTFCQANGWPSDRSPEEVQRWWSNCVNHPPEGLIRMGIIINEELIGYADLASINGDAAELGLAIGKSGLWGKGIGTQAAALMMEYGAEELNLTVFHAETHEDNIRSGRMLEKLGFQEVSRIGYEVYEGKNSQLIQFQFLYRK
ncbi:GNAT family N-acetyltransferase [Jeotgalibacillus haloalkalitolerans]|uniref:GNAT family N-acetyltransferase n=1 Tax=Jeotgalibacillus haloalkalitolerans TaxID=3104292 RepID=A0ABU5KHK4_9BACL|nr:GNAT family N-acetyltransferase [Jeotgalibacillus sp. HH7-29]MDZ5710707.1 GNAT family N-acetyltransferase [Jeotgalibacillus sp. HH7-29]